MKLYKKSHLCILPHSNKCINIGPLFEWGAPVVFKTDRIPRFGARCWLRWVRRSDLGWSPLPPSFLSSSPANNRAGEGLAVKEESAGGVRPAAAGEDTALRALTDRHRWLRSRDQ